jgi:hypothetical protein
MTAANAYAPHESKNNNKSQKQMRLPTPLRGHVMSRHKKKQAERRDDIGVFIASIPCHPGLFFPLPPT